jgi:gamma-glutamyltranspeptidase/glutathione hydrolase
MKAAARPWMLFWTLSASVLAQDTARPAAGSECPTRPLVRGRSYAVASMRPECTQVAEQMLRRGGNAFDAAVAAQAVLALVDAPNNGVGSDAMLQV